MDTQQINKALSENIFTKDIFLGVFASDQLPQRIEQYPACFIANVDSSAEPGSHWLAFYLPAPGYLEFFDSYGHPPNSFGGRILNYTSMFRFLDYNPLPLQSIATAVCGHYCVYYLYSRCRGMPLKNILLSFIPRDMSNDIKIYNFVTKYFNICTSFYQ